MRWLILVSLFVPSVAHAESWCAYPLWVHEWGVQSFDASGQPSAPVSMPRYFHRDAAGATPSATPTRHLPPDSGMRALPVLHFYSTGSLSSPIPVGVEVGFTHGEATLWYPQVNERRSASVANSPTAAAQRRALLHQRQPNPNQLGTQRTLRSDPTSQLVWDRLLLTPAPQHAQVNVNVPWVDALRELDAMWVNGASESERFVFYEATTRERVALALRRGSTWRQGRRHVVVENTSRFAVHDVFVTHREGERAFVFYAPSIPAGRSAGFVLEDHRVSDLPAATRGRLRTQLVDPGQPAPPTSYRWSSGCTMMREPALPVTSAEGHRLYAAEVDAILDIWAPRFFEQPGTTITYREDTAYLDAVMPLSLYTDMYNFIKLRRMGLATWRNVPLP
ncbi:MAG: hypothetical protein AAGE52_06210 [Myxococcota bacterium]